MFSNDIMQRITRTASTRQWRWLALPAGLLLVSTIYLLQGGPDIPKIGYNALLATTTTNNCQALNNLGGTSRLARTLEANENRYQYTMAEREKLIEKEGGSQIDIFPPRASRYYVLWDFFIPAYTCPFPLYRVGTLADGGKWVCGLERVLQDRPNCIVYSLNKPTPSYSSFESDILERSSGCEVYAFEANTASSKWPWGENEVTDLLASRVHFNEFSISDPSVTAKKYRSLQSVMQEFGHNWIDILKMDLMGSEFATLLSIIADNGEEPLPFGQLILTVNTGQSDDITSVANFKDWFNRLECAGLRPFYFEVDMMDVNNRRGEPGVVYWSFMNIRGTHALVDDSLPEYP
ncbi:methyltransferase domain-containing protein [Mycena galopus ATCC 62051]|nr:methyltransferase domain-containing protein [Mycena galopus ATCC 62051]